MGIFDDAEESSYKQFEPGYYNAVVTDAAVDLTDDPGFVKFEYTVSDSGDFHNRKLWRNFKLDPQGKGKLLTDLDKFGIRPENKKMETIDDLASAIKETIGTDISVKVVLNEKKDKPGEFWTNAYLKDVTNGQATQATSDVFDGVPNHAPQSDVPGIDKNEEIPF